MFQTKKNDKVTAGRITAKLEADPTFDAMSKESQRKIDDHLADYENKLSAANRTGDYVGRTVRFIRLVADHAEFETVSDISADGAHKYAGKLGDYDGQHSGWCRPCHSHCRQPPERRCHRRVIAGRTGWNGGQALVPRIT